MATGTLTQIGQDDWFAVTLAANEAVEFTFLGLSDYQSDQVGVLTTIDPAYSTETFNGGTSQVDYAFFTAPTAGTYYVAVSDEGSTPPAGYSVTANTVTTDYTNNTTTTGTVVVNGAAGTGTLTSAGQDDWLAVSLVANQGYEFALTDTNGNSQLTVGALTPAAVVIAEPSFSIPVTGTEEAFFRPTTSGIYYVDVATGSAATPDSYSVTATTVATDYTDNMTTSGTLATNGVTTTGTLTNVGQHDWLAVSLTGNQAYEFQITDSDGVESFTVGALTPASVQIGQVPETIGDNPGTQDAFFRPTTSGTYYVDVAGYGTSAGSYAISAVAVATDYTNNATTAGIVTVGGAAATGTLTNPGQDDWLAVNLVANQAYEVTITGLVDFAFASIGALDPATSATSEQISTFGTSATGYGFFRPTTSGTYYIDVGDVENFATAVPYTVAVQTVTTDYTNNSTTAATLVVGGAAATVTLTNIGQDDWVAVNLTANQAYEFTLSGQTETGYLSVGSLTTTDVTSTGSATNADVGGTADAFFRPSASGTFYVDISDTASGARTYTLTATAVSTDYADNPTTTGAIAVVSCFAAGTRIATARGDMRVEDLTVGEDVVTHTGARRPIRWIGVSTIDLDRHPRPERVAPVRIAPGAFGAGMPRRTLRLSPDHAVYIAAADVLVPVGLLVNERTIWREHAKGRVAYHHIELDSHDVIWAEGLPAESYLDTGNRANFDNAGVVRALYPDFGALAWSGLAYAELVVAGPRLAAVRAALSGAHETRAKRKAAG